MQVGASLRRMIAWPLRAMPSTKSLTTKRTPPRQGLDAAIAAEVRELLEEQDVPIGASELAQDSALVVVNDPIDAPGPDAESL